MEIGVAGPVWRAVIEVSGVGPGARVCDVGCGRGDFLAYARKSGMVPSGIDPAPDLVELARRSVPDVRLGGAEKLPWEDATFDLVTAFNSLQFAEDTDDALAEMVRVTRPGGHVAVANWAEAALNDLDAIERALNDGASPPDGDLRVAGGLRELLEDGGLVTVVEGLAEVPWAVPDEESLVSGILLDEDADLAREVVAAARPYRTATGGYRLINHFRYAIGRRNPAVGP